MREIFKESLKKMILNYFNWRFSRSSMPLSMYKIQVIIFEEKTKIDDEMRLSTYWKERI